MPTRTLGRESVRKNPGWGRAELSCGVKCWDCTMDEKSLRKKAQGGAALAAGARRGGPACGMKCLW